MSTALGYRVVTWLLCATLAPISQTRNRLVPLPEKHWGPALARHLLSRAAFEGRPRDVLELSSMTMRAAVDHLVDYERIAWDDAPSAPVLDPLLVNPMPREQLRGMQDSRRQLYRQTRRRADALQMQRVRNWWLQRMIASPRPLEEKMVLFWHSHFTSGQREVRNSTLLYNQNRIFRAHAMGDFEDLLLRVSSDPAMLLYLDSARNRKARPNENYARELLELFTLGEGHYTESDIKEAARAFTGWSVREGQFKFNRGQHDYGHKRFMRAEGPWNGGDIIQIILQQEQASRYVVRKLWKFFCYDDPERSVIDGLSATLRKSGYQLKPVVRQILRSSGFYSEKSRGSKIKSPIQLVVGSVRLLDVSDYDPQALNQTLAGMGQQLFQPPNVKGWDGGRKWINTATLLTRYQFAGAVVNGFPPRKGRSMMARMQDGVEAFGFLKPPVNARAGQRPLEPQRIVRTDGGMDAARYVKLLSERLLAVPLAERDQQAVSAFVLGATGGSRPPRLAAHPQVLRNAIHLLMSTPEYQLH